MKIRLTAVLASISIFFSLAASAQPTNDIPSLRPALPEMTLTIWERHAVGIVLAGIFVLAVIAALLWWLLKARPTVPEPIEVRTRRELELLRHRTDAGRALSEITRCLRRYLVAAFGLPADEVTTREFCRLLLTNPQIGPQLSIAVADFLVASDEYKFSPAETRATSGQSAPGRALELFLQCESRRKELHPATSTSK